MCKAFAAIITKSGKVYWKAGLDSHDELVEVFKKKDKELHDNKLPPENTFARVEIVPKDGNYLNLKQKWVFKLDENVKPLWFDASFEKPCRKALGEWQKMVYSQIDLKQVLNPVQPFGITPPSKITGRHLRLLKEWDNVWASVWDSVGVSVGAYISSMFPGIKRWKYIDHRKKPFKSIKGNPCRSAIKLWKMGLVPSYDGSKWRLHGAKMPGYFGKEQSVS